jgi:hypothetical protein
MAFKKAKQINLVTPASRFIYPKLNDPDYGTKEFPKPDGEYSLRLRFDTTDQQVQKFLKKLDALHQAAIENAKEEFAGLKVAQRKELERKNGDGGLSIHPFAKPVYDEDTEEPTNEVEMKFSMKAGGKTKQGKVWSRKPVIVDATGRVLRNPPAIWGGTLGMVSFSVSEGGYFIPGTGLAGISTRLEGVQILELVSAGGRDAKSLGFGSVDGYDGLDDADEEDDNNEEDTDDEEKDMAGDEEEDF